MKKMFVCLLVCTQLLFTRPSLAVDNELLDSSAAFKAKSISWMLTAYGMIPIVFATQVWGIGSCHSTCKKSDGIDENTEECELVRNCPKEQSWGVPVFLLSSAVSLMSMISSLVCYEIASLLKEAAVQDQDS